MTKNQKKQSESKRNQMASKTPSQLGDSNKLMNLDELLSDLTKIEKGILENCVINLQKSEKDNEEYVWEAYKTLKSDRKFRPWFRYQKECVNLHLSLKTAYNYINKYKTIEWLEANHPELTEAFNQQAKMVQYEGKKRGAKELLEGLKIFLKNGDKMEPLTPKPKASALKITEESLTELKKHLPNDIIEKLQALNGVEFNKHEEMYEKLENDLGLDAVLKYEDMITKFSQKNLGKLKSSPFFQKAKSNMLELLKAKEDVQSEIAEVRKVHNKQVNKFQELLKSGENKLKEIKKNFESLQKNSCKAKKAHVQFLKDLYALPEESGIRQRLAIELQEYGYNTNSKTLEVATIQ